ncbi:MAG TPA: succinate dehydrogenase cytochrome b subunit [Candidatus Polarisedimenticolaceae bacterium]|nr:succinate dehydrogenase cytochrome b subunit [Candidatus Polarisedimenticolaceae bacterium]
MRAGSPSVALEHPVPFVASTIGRKVVMAVTGVILFGFVLVHMIGNLQVFLPDHEAINHYGRFLREILHGTGIWIARGTLLAAVVLHIWSATSLTITNQKARPIGYRKTAPDASTYASRTMRWGGVIILLFVVYHILHMTLGTVHPAFAPGDVYRNVVTGFQVWPVTLFYVIAMIALGFHLRHGVWSMLQTLGISHPKWDRARQTAAIVFAVVVTIGFVAVPLSVLAGVVK